MDRRLWSGGAEAVKKQVIGFFADLASAASGPSDEMERKSGVVREQEQQARVLINQWEQKTWEAVRAPSVSDEEVAAGENMLTAIQIGLAVAEAAPALVGLGQGGARALARLARKGFVPDVPLKPAVQTARPRAVAGAGAADDVPLSVGMADDLAEAAVKKAAGEAAEVAARGALRFGADDLVYGPSAKGALRQFQQSAGGRLLTDVGGPGAGQSWARFSILTLEKQLAAGGRIRFDLTHVDDLAGLLKGTGQHAGSVTAQELRFLQANWERFSGNTSFYRGGAEVAAPW